MCLFLWLHGNKLRDRYNVNVNSSLSCCDLITNIDFDGTTCVTLFTRRGVTCSTPSVQFCCKQEGRTCPKKIVFRRGCKISVNTPFHVTFTLDEL